MNCTARPTRHSPKRTRRSESLHRFRNDAQRASKCRRALTENHERENIVTTRSEYSTVFAAATKVPKSRAPATSPHELADSVPVLNFTLGNTTAIESLS
jgi:hypothetical protein